MKKRLAIFLDLANIEAAAQCRLDYGSLRQYIAGDRELIESFAFVPIDPRNPQCRDATVNHLQQNGWLVTKKMGKPAGDTYKANVDVELTIAVIRGVEAMRPDAVVLVSGDGDFVPLIRFLRERGIHVETAAFRNSVSRESRAEANGFIELDLWLAGQDCHQQIRSQRSGTHWSNPPQQAYPPMPHDAYGRQGVYQQGVPPHLKNLPPLPPQGQGGQPAFARQGQNVNGEPYFFRKPL